MHWRLDDGLTGRRTAQKQTTKRDPLTVPALRPCDPPAALPQMIVHSAPNVLYCIIVLYDTILVGALFHLPRRTPKSSGSTIAPQLPSSTVVTDCCLPSKPKGQREASPRRLRSTWSRSPGSMVIATTPSQALPSWFSTPFQEHQALPSEKPSLVMQVLVVEVGAEEEPTEPPSLHRAGDMVRRIKLEILLYSHVNSAQRACANGWQ